MNSYAMFTASTLNYIGYTNALLNSVEKRKLYENCDLDFYLFYTSDFPESYINDIKNKFSFRVIPVIINRSDINIDIKTNFKEFIKRVRYKKIIDVGFNYDVICLLDSDMFFVSNEFINLMNLVKGTDLLIGCNERYKWHVDNYYFKHNKKRIVEKNGRMFKFICNTPAIFDLNYWQSVFESYVDIAINGIEYKHGDDSDIRGIGDIFCWNLAINRLGYQNKVIPFPMESMAQVHQTANRYWTHIIKSDGDYWHTFAGDPIYVIHGRVAQRNVVSGGENKFDEIHKGQTEILKKKKDVTKGLENIQAEWYDLNYNYNVKLIDYIPENPEWKDFKKG